MTKKQIINEWLANQERQYAAGLALFNEVARPFHKEKYAAYFAQVENPAMFDPHFTQLVDVLCKIAAQMRNEAHLYPTCNDEVVTKVESKIAADDKVKELVEAREEKILALQEEVDELTQNLEQLSQDSGDNTNEIEDLQLQLSQHEDQIADLQKEVEELSKPGVKVVVEGDMPKSIKQAYARIKEIAPLYGSLHNDIANEATSEADRKKYAEQLCKLDDERRKLWDKIDSWSEGKHLEVDEDRPAYSDNSVVRGFELLRARKRIKENILNSKKAMKKAEKDGKLTTLENAKARIARYEIELQEVEAEINSQE